MSLEIVFLPAVLLVLNISSAFTHTVQKLTFFIKDFHKKCHQIRKKRIWSHFTFTEEILNGKLQFLYSVNI